MSVSATEGTGRAEVNPVALPAFPVLEYLGTCIGGVFVSFKFICRVGALVVTGLAVASTAVAQGFNLERLPNVPQASDGFATSRLLGLGQGRWGLSVVADYANDPLVVRYYTPRENELSLVEHYLAAHVAFSASVTDNLLLFAGVDVPFFIDGDSDPRLRDYVTFSNGGGIGDAWLGGKVAFVGEKESDPFALGAQASVTLPLSRVDSDQAYRGEDTITATPQLIAELRLPYARITGNAGVLFRGETPTPAVTLGHDFRYAVAVGMPVHPRVEILAEAFGSSPLTDFADRHGVDFEWLLGPKFNTETGLFAGAAFGTGITSGIGSPNYRALISLGYHAPESKPPPPPPAPLVVEPRDDCPGEDEDMDGFEDEDGCPDPDNDGDGIPDQADTCPNQPEDFDQFEDEDGCPEEGAPPTDSDGDGLMDPDDACPNQPEDFDQFEDEDGCPDPDNDGDGIPDEEDQCPREPGKAEDNGCPKSVRVSESAIQITQQIQFATGQDTILEASFALMHELVSVLQARSEIQRVRVEGHTDSRGADAMNMQLSKRRASSVRRWLVENGVAPERLEAWGCGESSPIASNDSADGRAENRRVVFHILDPKPASLELPSSCEPAD